jgi:hypothetical protein
MEQLQHLTLNPSMRGASPMTEVVDQAIAMLQRRVT